MNADMNYEITLSIAEDSIEGKNIDSMAEIEHISREEAARKLLTVPVRKSAASPEAFRIIGAFSSPEDSALMDEVMGLVMSDRERHNAEPPRV